MWYITRPISNLHQVLRSEFLLAGDSIIALHCIYSTLINVTVTLHFIQEYDMNADIVAFGLAYTFDSFFFTKPMVINGMNLRKEVYVRVALQPRRRSLILICHLSVFMHERQFVLKAKEGC